MNILIIALSLVLVACQPQTDQALSTAKSLPTDSTPEAVNDPNNESGTLVSYSENIDEISYKITYNCQLNYCSFNGYAYRYVGMKKINNVFKNTFYKAEIRFNSIVSSTYTGKYIGSAWQPTDYLGVGYSSGMPVMFDRENKKIWFNYGSAITGTDLVTEEQFEQSLNSFDGHIVFYLGGYHDGPLWSQVLNQ